MPISNAFAFRVCLWAVKLAVVPGALVLELLAEGIPLFLVPFFKPLFVTEAATDQ
jgi:hypothetical protein